MSFLYAVVLTKTLPCLADAEKCIVIGRPSRYLDGVLPLVAAVAPNVLSFNPATGTLTLRRQPGFITFYPDCVMITQVVPMAFAFLLLLSKRALDDCPVLASDGAFSERRAQLAAMI